MTPQRDPDAHTTDNGQPPPRLRDDAWIDRDGHIHTSDGPYQHRWTRRLRRALRPHHTRWLR